MVRRSPSCPAIRARRTRRLSSISPARSWLSRRRAEIGVEFVTQGAPPDIARCISGQIVGAYSIEDLYSADAAQFQTQEFFDQVRRFAETCDAQG